MLPVRSLLLISLIISGLSIAAQSPISELEQPERVRIASFNEEFSYAHLEQAKYGDSNGIAVIFEGTDDLHFYAQKETAPAEDNLKVKASGTGIVFGEPVYPKWDVFHNSAQEDNVAVYVGDFTFFIPVLKQPESITEVNVEITGIGCTSTICLNPFTRQVSIYYDPQVRNLISLSFEPGPGIKQSALQAQAKDDNQQQIKPSIAPYGLPVYMLLAIIAGISINVMPCVLPVIPIIIMRLLEQARQDKKKRLISGFAFCGGIVLFFIVFAVISATIYLTTDSVININSLFRYPTAVIILFLAIIFFGLVLLDVFAIVLPSSVANKQTGSSSIAGSISMGFFAGILSTPCSGAILGFVLVWAQTQPPHISSTAIILMGVGMALPYAILISIPKLLDKIPKPGTWMEIFKKTCGFLLFAIAVKLTLAALPKERLLNVLMYGVIFSFCVWMWGKWVSFSAPASRKWSIRILALIIAISAGFWLLPSNALPTEIDIHWTEYDSELIEASLQAGRPVLIKFTADWCSNCKILEKKVYRDAKVAELIKLKNVLAIKGDTTLHTYPAYIDFIEKYGEAGNIPVTIILLQNQEPVKMRAIFKKHQLIKILEKLPSPVE